jgi:hypothetical protein
MRSFEKQWSAAGNEPALNLTSDRLFAIVENVRAAVAAIDVNRVCERRLKAVEKDPADGSEKRRERERREGFGKG